MKNLLLTGMACAGLLLALPETAMAHGGQYRGPGDVVPPNPGGGGRTGGPKGPVTPGPGGPATPGPGGPSTPGPAGPATGGPAGPAGPGPKAAVTGAGTVVGDDLTRWEFWWEFNKDPYINLREAVQTGDVTTGGDLFYMGAGEVQVSKDTLKPTETQIFEEVLPALNRALESTDQRDITSSCMVALAKIGKDTEQVKILPIFRKRLTVGDQEVRETAALSLGLSSMTEAVDDLIGLITDSPKGRELCERGEVDDRTRSYAAYGLSLITYATSDNAIKRKALDAYKSILEDDTISDRNIRVAVINACGLLRPVLTSQDGAEAEADGKALFMASLDALEAYWNLKLGAGQQLIQSHCPPAIAKLYNHVDDLDADSNLDLRERLDGFKKDWLLIVQDKSKRKVNNNNIPQSAIVALGRTTAPNNGKDTPPLDLKISKALLEYSQKGRDLQAKYFAMMALGQIGGEENRKDLMTAFAKGSKALEKPWAALSLGVLAYKQYEAMGSRATIDTGIGSTLAAELGKLKNPSTLASLSVSLGLCRYTDAGDTLLQLMETYKNQDGLAGYICIGLALMGEQRATAPIRDLVAASVRRPERLQQAAIALGKLGDKNAAEQLVGLMTEGSNTNLAKMSAIASALGYIGDRRTIDPLIKMLQDEGLTPLSRAFAAVALGGISEKELLPWNSKIAVNMNYRASVETLTNRQSGILDIL